MYDYWGVLFFGKPLQKKDSPLGKSKLYHLIVNVSLQQSDSSTFSWKTIVIPSGLKVGSTFDLIPVDSMSSSTLEVSDI
jgi:hypothetical protein